MPPPPPPPNVYPCLDWVPKNVVIEKPNRLKLSDQEKLINVTTDYHRGIHRFGASVDSKNQFSTTQENSIKSPFDTRVDNFDDHSKDIIIDGELRHSEVVTDETDTTRILGLDLSESLASNTTTTTTPTTTTTTNAPTNTSCDQKLDFQNHPYQIQQTAIQDNDEYTKPLRCTENCIIAGHISKEESTIEVYVYDSERNRFYIHHEIIQSDYLCCVKWIGHARNQAKNLAAAGYMNPDIYLWDLDGLNVVEPSEILKGHKDAVIDINWNSQVKNIIASGSADKHVRIWSLDECKSISNIKLPGKVSAIEFGIYEQFLLLAGDLSSNVSLIDTRTGTAMDTWKLAGEVEKVRWAPKDHSKFLVSDDQGCVYCFDLRFLKDDQPTVKFQAHKTSVTGLEFSPMCSDMLVTASADDTIKVWDTKTSFRSAKSTSGIEPTLIKEVDHMNVGSILGFKICPNTFGKIAVGGDSVCNSFTTYDLMEEREIREHFLEQ